MTAKSNDDPICCPRFDPAPWDDKIHQWNNRRFLRDRVFTLFYMPLGFGRAMTRLNRAITAAGAETTDWLCLSDHTSPWNMDLYLEVTKEVPGGNNSVLNGSFFSKVYEGSFSETGQWNKNFSLLLQTKGLAEKKRFFWYTTCPKCAKKYGTNFVVLIAQLGDV